ncbi:ABC transporter ATP-binding protein [Georgenia sp. TF02-10]|uniref:ABC transporter ATP-binding protein n=1 Tax=Georgenia sp. TF02-10 TaxID=2917725 RepID=UPI001FA780D0|nr:ABC transporter ATP-binding protein [Georgenia sp. TF02-10]UNX54791.1 ABC transporter ATP-binding protein [Georgenia sp. TF02-10]
MDTSVITAHALRRTYGSGSDSFEAVRGIDLQVRRGELFALLGTNGAGKTSTLEVLEGLAPASAGRVRVLGHDPYRERHAVRPRTGTMLQDAGFPPELTAAETARLWHGTLSRPVPVDQALAAVGLEHRAGVHVAALSGGEQRRLDLALAIMGRPEVLFLDEPTTGLDPQSRRATWDLVAGLLHEGVTVLLTTHYLEEAETLADRLAIMHAGRVARAGTVAEIVATETARITFADDADVPALELTALPALAAAPARERGRWTLTATDLQVTLTALLTAAGDAGVQLTGLEARSASLEQAFLAVAADDDAPTAHGSRRTAPVAA